MDQLDKYLDDKTEASGSKFTIVNPIKDYKKIISELGLTKATKEANFRFRERYVQKSKEFNSFESLNEGKLVKLSLQRGLIPGKIYTYKYSPKWKDELDYYDIQPMMLSLGSFKAGNTVLEMGINLHFLPKDAVKKILELTWKVFELKLEKNFNLLMAEKFIQIPLPMYRNAKKIFEIVGHTHYKFAMRNYLRNRMKDLQIIEYTDWKYLPLLDSKWIIGASKSEIYNLYIKEKKDKNI